MKLDLLLGSDIGSWALERVAIDQIEQVITLDEGLAERSRALGLRTILGNVNFVDYVPSQIGFSLHYSAILKPDLIRKYQKIFNLHPAGSPFTTRRVAAVCASTLTFTPATSCRRFTIR